MIFVKIALLNMLKHPKRSLLIVAVVALSVIAMLLVGGMADGMRHRFFDNMFQESGHLQIHDRAYRDRIDPLSLDSTISDPDLVIHALKKNPRAVAVEKLIHFGAKMIFGEKNLLIAGEGVVPATAFYTKARQGIVAGAFLPDGRGIAVSRRVAALLGCGPEETVSLLVAWTDGTPYYLDYPVSGIFETDSHEFDDNYFFISHQNAEELLSLQDRTVEIRVTLRDPAAADRFRTEEAGILAERNLAAETWKETFGSFVVLLDFFDFFMIFMNLFVLVVAATVITNTVLMSVFERVRDFGTLRAVGLKKRHVLMLILSEGILEGIFGSLIGLGLAIPIVLYLQAHGLPIGEIAESMRLGNTFPFALTLQNTAFAFVFGSLVAVAGSLYAALVNARMKLTDALRYG